MAALKAKKTFSNFKKKGFIEDNTSKHHIYYEFYHEGQLVARTYSSHNSQDIDDHLIREMKKQCKMEKEFFIAFAKCDKSQEDYIQILKDGNYISSQAF